MEINFRSIFNDLNVSRFVVFSCLLTFSLFLALKLDGFKLSLLIVFSPIWLGELLVFIGFFIGLVSFILTPPQRADISSKNDFLSICFQTLEHIFLLAFEILLYLKIQQLKNEVIDLTWLLVFAPLLILSFIAMIISVWCIRHDKPLAFELFLAVNIVQFALFYFKLDNIIHWNWTSVFVPTWALFSIFYIGSIYSLLISMFLNRTLIGLSSHRRAQMCNSTCHLFLGIPLLMFFILLSLKLDSLLNEKHPYNQTPYIVISIPLFFSLISSMLLSFGNSGNDWWFGRKSFCNILFDAFPCLQYYANISYKFESPEMLDDDSENVRMINTQEPFVSIANTRQVQSHQNNTKSASHLCSSIESPD